jgi:hypothetical protein
LSGRLDRIDCASSIQITVARSKNVTFNSAIDAILAAAGPMPLDAGIIDTALSQQLSEFHFDAAIPSPRIADRAAVQACLAGLWLRANDLDRSHRISQELATPEGSFWHAIVHRREGDYGNSKYWFRRVGRHPAFTQIAPDWDPFAFVDRVEAFVTRHVGDEKELQELQLHEWEALFEFCWNRALS